jgi:hypothetical protein
MGYAMPDGSYYIRAGSVGASDLQNAIDAVGRGEPQSSHNAIRVHIMKRAKALGLLDKIPDNWQADGSLKQGVLLGQRVDDFLEHFGVMGMRWGHHLPGVEALGGPGNGDRRPAPFIQRGDHTGDKSGDSGQSGQNGSSPEQQARDSIDALKTLRDRVTQAAASAKAQAEGTAPTDLTQEQAAAVHAASAAHQAHVAQIHNKAVAAATTHKAALAKIAKQPATVKAKKAKAAAAKLHAAHMNHLKKVAHQAHAAHVAHVAKLKVKTKVSELTAQDKRELAKLSPPQRSALKKLTPQQRATLNKMTPAQRAKLSHLTQAEKTALSHLTPRQKEALAKATAASARKRHAAAAARKPGTKPVPVRKTAPKSKTSTPHVAPVAAGKLRAISQHSALDGDQAGEFLEHFGIKGMKWGIRRNGGHPGRARGPSSEDHLAVTEIKSKIKAGHGIHALTNDELRKVTERLNLEANYHRLAADQTNVDRGRETVKKILGDVKTGLDIIETGKRVQKTFEQPKKAAA